VLVGLDVAGVTQHFVMQLQLIVVADGQNVRSSHACQAGSSR
jgi:hypothetical protein